MRARSILAMALGASLSAGCGGLSGSTLALDGSTNDAANDDASDAAIDAANEPPGPPSGVGASALYDVTTLAGSGSPIFADGTGAAAGFYSPADVVVGADGNVYVADQGEHRIRKVTPAGVVTTLAGSGTSAFADGTGATASFSSPSGVAVDAAGNVYVSDWGTERIRIVTAGGVVTTLAGSGTPGFADGPGAAARFNGPTGIAVDAAGNAYVGDYQNSRIRKVTAAGAVTTLAGSGSLAFADGTGAAASFDKPSGIAVDAAGNVYVTDHLNHRIRKVTATGVVTTLAGSGKEAFADGSGAAAAFSRPSGVAVDAAGNVYVADSGNNRIRKVTATGVVTTVAGSGSSAFADGTGAAASFAFPEGIAIDGAGDFYVADWGNDRIRKLTPVGIGQLAVTWIAPIKSGSSAITGYTATAHYPNQTTETCTTAGPTSCTISGLTSGLAYIVSVTATNAAGTGAPSAPTLATPN